MAMPSSEQVAAAATVALANSIASKITLEMLVTAAATMSSHNKEIILGALAIGETHLDLKGLEFGLPAADSDMLKRASDLAHEQLEALRKMIREVQPVDKRN